MSDGLGQLLLMSQVALTGDHDALSLRRAGAVHGLGAVTHRSGAQSQVLDQAQDAQTVLGGHGGHAAEILVDDGAQLGIPEVRLGGEEARIPLPLTINGSPHRKGRSAYPLPLTINGSPHRKGKKRAFHFR